MQAVLNAAAHQHGISGAAAVGPVDCGGSSGRAFDPDSARALLQSVTEGLVLGMDLEAWVQQQVPSFKAKTHVSNEMLGRCRGHAVLV